MTRASLRATALALLTLGAGAAAAEEFESPLAEAPPRILPAELAAGPDFQIVDPVPSDGLLRHYTVNSRFGSFAAVGGAALAARVREVQALARLSRTSNADVVAGSIGRGVASQIESVATVAAHPVRTVTGIPTGIAHLFHGYTDQGREAVAGARRASGGAATGTSAAPAAAADSAKRYAARYLGVTGAERRWYRQFGVDPYTDNEPLRHAIHQHARVEAATGLGIRLAAMPGIPGVGVLQQAEHAIYEEDPATLRARARRTLATYGLAPAEIDALSNSMLLSPTRQALLLEAGAALEGVEGRSELFRHALGLHDELEAQVYVESVALLVAAHRERPLVTIVAGVRVPSAVRADGQVVVAGAFDALYWTADVAEADGALRGSLPPAASRELRVAGAVSPNARAALTARGWTLREPGLAPESPPTN